MKTNMLKQFKAYCEAKKGTFHQFAIPDLWQTFGYTSQSALPLADGQIVTDPYDYFNELIDSVYLNHKETPVQSISLKKGLNSNGDWLKSSVLYSSLIRTSSAWDHDRSGALETPNKDGFKETGTFVKMLAVLPYLKSMGVDALYLLPIMRFSKAHKKGDMGSPYSVSNFFKLDEALKDPLTGDKFSIEDEFRLLVEAAHTLNMRVIIDIIPRTNAIDSEFLYEHPDWFYWIKKDALPSYGPPRYKGIPSTAIPKESHMKKVYEDKQTLNHIKQFSKDPKTLDPTLFDKIKNGGNLLEAVEKHFGLTVAPAFSDHINDPQPPWSDITFFRLYFDHPEIAKPYINKDTPPYILFDSIKANLYPGKKPNEALWDTLAKTIPYYQKTFGIDGARIDMGHALPKPLLDRIIKNAKDIDPDFGFIAEELNNDQALDAKDKGYNMIIGNGFFAQPRVFDGHSKYFYYNTHKIDLPLFAAAETHDTPRIASREGGITLAKTINVLNMFTPNGVPFINGGAEFYEKQPMNLGLDSTEKDKKHLHKQDPYYGKLALFDKYQLHYTAPLRYQIPAIYKAILPIRKALGTVFFDKDNVFHYKSDNPFFIGYIYILDESLYMVFANLNPFFDEQASIDIKAYQTKANNTKKEGTLLFSTNEPKRKFTQFIDDHTIDIHLAKGEVKIVKL